jgi:hypothetical protein
MTGKDLTILLLGVALIVTVGALLELHPLSWMAGL